MILASWNLSIIHWYQTFSQKSHTYLGYKYILILIIRKIILEELAHTHACIWYLCMYWSDIGRDMILFRLMHASCHDHLPSGIKGVSYFNSSPNFKPNWTFQSLLTARIEIVFTLIVNTNMIWFWTLQNINLNPNPLLLARNIFWLTF